MYHKAHLGEMIHQHTYIDLSIFLSLCSVSGSIFSYFPRCQAGMIDHITIVIAYVIILGQNTPIKTPTCIGLFAKNLIICVQIEILLGTWLCACEHIICESTYKFAKEAYHDREKFPRCLQRKKPRKLSCALESRCAVRSFNSF